MNRLKQSYAILEELRLPNGMYLASTGEDYQYVWLRDSFYEVLPYLNKYTDYYEKTYHRIFDMLIQYEDKIHYHTVHRPRNRWQYIHARYTADTVEEIGVEWGHAQHDATGAILFGIGVGVEAGRPMFRNKKDEELVQLLVDYLGCCEYWHDPDNGMWEEDREVHMSSVGAVVAGLEKVRDLNLADVPEEWIKNGREAINSLFPRESRTKNVDLAQLSLIYPYNILTDKQAQNIIDNVEMYLVRQNGVLRYQMDSYYSTLEADHGRYLPRDEYIGTEAEWTFGYPWLSLAHLHRGDLKKAQEYIEKTEDVMLPNSDLPELYYAHSRTPNPNTPLRWSNAMYILAKEAFEDIEKQLHT